MLDKDLEASLGLEFTQRDIETKTPAELAEAFGRVVYCAMARHFEEKKAGTAHAEKKERSDPRLEELRALKKELRKSLREVLRSGGKGSETERLLNKRWFAVVHEHAKLSRLLKAKNEAKWSTRRQRKFREDPMKFGKSLFEKSVSGAPEFGEKEGFEYFSKLYRDVSRGEKVEPLEEMKRPAKPSFLLSEDPPSEAELKGIIKLKRNSAAPGIDGILYVPFKRCPCLVKLLVKIFRKVWKTRDVPVEWSTASIQLLPKSPILTDPAEFRPIALTNTIGKIFFAVIAKRLEKYMAENKFISQVQKGFKAETPGCLEHSFAMFEALLDAKRNRKQIVVAWLDLCNAYGSVRHNLVQFALDGIMCL